MKKICFFLTMLLAVSVAQAQRKASLDQDWKFHRGDVVNGEAIDFDDTRWRTLTVPHDFSMEPAFTPSNGRQHIPGWSDVQIGPFSRLNFGDRDTGQTVGGTGWYRKTFILPVQYNTQLDTYLSQHQVNIRFDGVYNQAEVWVNGVKAAVNVYGYMPFVVNLNKILSDPSHRRTDNEHAVTVVVKAVNEGENSRWYAGSGIFRHVWLETTEKIHLDEWDAYVDASELINKGKDANVKVFAKVFNESNLTTVTQFCVDILDAKGTRVAHQEVEVNTGANTTEGTDVSTELTVKSPRLWSLDNPYRYTAKLYVSKAGEEKDALYIPFGIRTIRFSAEEGFLLNGKSVKLHGGCVHHDNGLLGGAGIDRAEMHKVELMKSAGYNAVRCSHNLPTEAFLHACDSLGMLVIDEVFDQW
ncbi:MAG: glycoside hydrolase family 2, partial [Bacteroidaceae bacterium]|nr:glycoside hydrolase family 2 [Bacteroidaceae bacterium]